VLRDVVEADDARVADEQAEDPLAGRVVADRGDRVLVRPVGDELADRLVVADHAERRVARAR
jgi:hypothetical protein